MFFSSVVVKDGGYNDYSNKQQDEDGERNYGEEKLLVFSEHNIPIKIKEYNIMFNGLLMMLKSVKALVAL